MPMYKMCPKCKRMYSWNPDVGKMYCPRCGSMGAQGIKLLLDILKKRKKI